MRRRNLSTPLGRRWSDRDAMAAFDRLPPPVRRWLWSAALPWSAVSAARIWHRALAQTGGCEVTALTRLAAAEAAMLAREARVSRAKAR